MGNSAPEFLIAARTRSLDSCTDESGRPTILNRGTPGEISTSTSTSCPSTPLMAQVFVLASNLHFPFFVGSHGYVAVLKYHTTHVLFRNDVLVENGKF